MDVKTSVLNQSMIFNILKQAKKQNRLSHAYLFYGEDGVGKKEMAYALACLMYCPNDGCLECETCRSIIENNHMNVDYIGIEASKTMISKDQIVELQEEFSKTSLVDGSRIYIVDGIDTASMAAQNSLLKFIEEPINSTPTIGIFLAKDTSNVVPTILSRCALQHFKAIPEDKMIEALINDGVDEFNAILASSLTNSIVEAKEIINSSDFIKTKGLFIDFLNLKKSKEGVLYYLSNVNHFSNPKNLSILLQWVLMFLEDVNINGNSSDNLILKPLYDKIIIYKSNYEKSLKDRLKLVLDLFNKLKYNVSAKNIFHELIVKLI